MLPWVVRRGKVVVCPRIITRFLARGEGLFQRCKIFCGAAYSGFQISATLSPISTLAPKGRHKIACGNATGGDAIYSLKPCKGDIKYFAPSGLDE
jgi:hypothetical protein